MRNIVLVVGGAVVALSISYNASAKDTPTKERLSAEASEEVTLHDLTPRVDIHARENLQHHPPNLPRHSEQLAPPEHWGKSYITEHGDLRLYGSSDGTEMGVSVKDFDRRPESSSLGPQFRISIPHDVGGGGFDGGLGGGGKLGDDVFHRSVWDVVRGWFE